MTTPLPDRTDAAAVDGVLLGFRLRTLREEAGLSRAAAGELLGCSEESIRDVESGRRRPDLRRLVSMSTMYGSGIRKVVGDLNPYSSGSRSSD